ncbi:MAG: molybdopterin-dependent oxidoreductase [Alphaproteobacteria bacterium]|nr:molybdopterin-dependent oxidoreductase [Alphaproteobacteria bacterium]
MDRRTFLASASSVILGGMLAGMRSADADAGSLAVRATPSGPLITPNGRFFVYSQMRDPARLSAGIQIDGLVGAAARYSLADLAALPHVEHLWTMECFVNTAGGPLIFTTPFKGVPLAALFEKTGVKPEARSARVETSDGHPIFPLPLSELQRPGAMLVATLGSQPVPLRHGSPYTRLFIPGVGANHNPKWVTRITLIDQPAPEHPAPSMAGFLSPAPPEAAGSLAGVALTGYAFTGPEPVGSIELSTDNGATYRPMPLPPQPDPNIWVTWEVTWRPPGRGFYVLRVRATSANGRKQDTPGVIAVEVR